jgi:hypothetical protein
MTATSYTSPAYPLQPLAQIEFWNDLRNYYAALCRACRISGDYPVQFGLWEAEVRRADMQVSIIKRYYL